MRGAATTPYVNTIPVEQQPDYPGDRDIERRLKHIIRWNAMAMVVRANQQSHGIGGHISTYASAATLYEVAFNHFFHGKEGRAAAGSGVLSGSRRAGRLCAGVSAGAAHRRALEELPPRVAADAGAVVVSASVADAGFLGVPDGVDGLGPDHGDLSGTVQPLSGRSRDQARRGGVAGLGIFGRRRMRRAGDARRDHAGRAREARQFDLRRELQSAAARRTGARQRQDHSGVGRGLSRCGLERHQGDLGLRLGSAAGPRHRRRARAADGRGGRRRSIRNTSSARAITSASISSASIRGSKRSWPI